MITKARLEQLRAELQQQRDQQLANANAANGAVSLLDRLIAECETDVPPPPIPTSHG